MTINLPSNMLYNRQRALLGIIQQLNEHGIYSRTYLMKLVFLLKENSTSIGYDFFPYKFGPYSQTMFDDLNDLQSKGYLTADERRITSLGKEEKSELGEAVEKVNKIISKFKNKDEILKFVYNKYPEYKEKSILIKHTKNKDKGICSIGYEGKSPDFFINQLIQNKVSILVDVRKNAFSMKKGFSKSQLQKSLKKVEIEYTHIPSLGIESDKRKHLETKEDYAELFKEYKKELPTKHAELKKLEELSKDQKIALMCFEKDHNYCHRGQISDCFEKVLHL